jgi:hypothetical protein
MRQIEHRLRNVEARIAASIPGEPLRIVRQVIGLNPEGYWSIVCEIDDSGNETQIPLEKQIRLQGTSDATAAESFKIRTGEYPKWYLAQRRGHQERKNVDQLTN